jgi:DNA-binding response OmpR family regulator
VKLPRILLLEDDPALRLFVQLVLKPLSVDVVACSTLAEARQALEDDSVQLVFTDLTLPDGSGLDLLQWLQARTQPSDTTYRAVVFSGGVNVEMDPKLKALQVWRVLHKPASVGSLMACVADALASLVTAVSTAAPAIEGLWSDPEAEFFGGNRALYDAYRAASLAQFPHDLDDADLAARTGDAQTLRRVAHNVKSVLTMLGDISAAQQARVVEEAAARGDDSETLYAAWRLLRSQMQDHMAKALSK